MVFSSSLLVTTGVLIIRIPRYYPFLTTSSKRANTTGSQCGKKMCRMSTARLHALRQTLSLDFTLFPFGPEGNTLRAVFSRVFRSREAAGPLAGARNCQGGNSGDGG